jgi:hypothetical protein
MSRADRAVNRCNLRHAGNVAHAPKPPRAHGSDWTPFGVAIAQLDPKDVQPRPAQGDLAPLDPRTESDGWETDPDHRAFGERMGPHLATASLGMPDHLEHLWIAQLGWDAVPAEAS